MPVVMNLFVSVVIAVVAGLIAAAVTRRKAVALPLAAGLFVLAVAVSFIANPPREIPVIPEVVGKSRDEARAEIERLGFKCEVKEEVNDVVDFLKVFNQSPQRGIRYNRGSTVTIWVSKGKPPDVPPAPSVPAESLLVKLAAANITLTEIKDHEKQVKIWLRDDPAYQALARGCLDVLGGKRIRDRIPLEVINGRFKELLGSAYNDYVPASKYADRERLRTAIFRTWKERHSDSPERSFGEILQ
jgi:hypothetical protein